jgi:hypothetical protein
MIRTMTKSPEDINTEAEDLAKMAVEDKIGVQQIRNLYKVSETEGLIEFKNFVRYKMSKSDDNGRVILSPRFGDKLISILPQCQKEELKTLLRWTIMLYYFYNKLKDNDVRNKIEQVIESQNKRSGFGFAGIKNIEYKDRQGKTTIYVKLNNFRGNKGWLRNHLENTIRTEVEEIRNTNFNVWLDTGDVR